MLWPYSRMALCINTNHSYGKGLKVAKKTAEYAILKRVDGRYAVKSVNNKFINGDDKVTVLIAEGLRSAPAPKSDEPAAEEAASAEASAAE